MDCELSLRKEAFVVFVKPLSYAGSMDLLKLRAVDLRRYRNSVSDALTPFWSGDVGGGILAA
jgi:hypothetical protein